MRVLIIGGAASGKSEFAEELILRLPGPHIYLATMEPFGQEGRERIRRHRDLRAGKGFTTVERCVDLPGLRLPEGAGVLLEDLPNLVANERYRPDGAGSARVLLGMEQLSRDCAHVVAVTGEVFSGGRDYLDDTLNYMKELAWINRRWAAMSDLVVEVVCGMPNVLKGALP